MVERLILQFVTLAIFLFTMGITFCDFYKLNMVRKFFWFLVFMVLSVRVLYIRGEFDLGLILPVPMLLAVMLARFQNQKKE